MPSPRRKPKPFRGDLSPEALDQMTGPELWRLVEAGLITSADVSAATRRGVLALNGGVDPYAHLRAEWEAAETFGDRPLVPRRPASNGSHR